MKKFDITIIGGDRRTACMAQVFREKGLRTISYGTVTLPKSPPACRADSLQVSYRRHSDATAKQGKLPAMIS